MVFEIVTGLAGIYCLGRVLGALFKEKAAPSQKTFRESYEPVDCRILPRHEWSWFNPKKGGAGHFRCPMCTGWNGDGEPDGQPPYCPEDGGHFHFQCNHCRYEWAMLPYIGKENERTGVVHTLKTWPGPFAGVESGRKRYELRTNDRDYKVGDTLLLQEWVPAHESPCDWKSRTDEQQTEDSDVTCTLCHRNRGKKEPLPGTYTGASARARVTYVTTGGTFGLPAGLCVMGISAPYGSRKESAL